MYTKSTYYKDTTVLPFYFYPCLLLWCCWKSMSWTTTHTENISRFFSYSCKTQRYLKHNIYSNKIFWIFLLKIITNEIFAKSNRLNIESIKSLYFGLKSFISKINYVLPLLKIVIQSFENFQVTKFYFGNQLCTRVSKNHHSVIWKTFERPIRFFHNTKQIKFSRLFHTDFFLS